MGNWRAKELAQRRNLRLTALHSALRGQLRGAAHFLSAWGRHEMPTRAKPLSALFASALAGAASLARDFPMAVGILLAFHAFLRPTELCTVEWRNFGLLPELPPCPAHPPQHEKRLSHRQERNQSSLMIRFLCQALHRLQAAHAAIHRTWLLHHDSVSFRHMFAGSYG